MAGSASRGGYFGMTRLRMGWCLNGHYSAPCFSVLYCTYRQFQIHNVGTVASSLIRGQRSQYFKNFEKSLKLTIGHKLGPMLEFLINCAVYFAMLAKQVRLVGVTGGFYTYCTL